jgi:Carboxypeptidase regulatory-like domain
MRTFTITCVLGPLTAAMVIAAVPESAKPLVGTVLAADGSPAAGAIVWAAKLASGPLERQETVADAKGQYKLELDPGRWLVMARCGTQGGEAPASHEPVEIVLGQAPQPLTIRLEERGTFRGRLIEAETQKPIRGGRLFLDAGVALVTDEAGRFEIGGLSRRDHEAFVVAPGRMRLRVLFDTTTRADTELEVPVPRAGTMVGRVTDMDGKPIPGAYVGRHTSGSYFAINGLFTACDAAGKFEYDDAVPPDQPTRLGAHAPGYVEDERHGLIVPPDGKPIELQFRLRPAPGAKPMAKAGDDEKRRVVAGIVREPGGKPAAGVLVRWGYQPYVGAIQNQTDAEGRFRLTVPDKADMLAVLPREFPPQFPRVEAGGDQSVEVTLAAGQTARGRVIDDSGKPISNVRVVAVVGSPDPRIGNPYWLAEAAVLSDADGKFALKGVPKGARFDFLKTGLSDLRNQELDLARADNAVTMAYGGAVSGLVADQDGKPIRNFRVLVGFPRLHVPGDRTEGFFAGYSGMGVRFTSADGSFVLTGVGAGSVYRIQVMADGHGEAVSDRVVAVPLNRLPGTKPVTLRAGPPVALRLRAVGSDGKPIAGARITLVNGGPRLDKSFAWGYDDANWQAMERGRTGADGWAAFPALSFAEATALVQAPGFGRYRLSWRNRQMELTAELAAEAVLAGVVRDATGAPVREFHVSLMSGGDQIGSSVGPDDKGRFRIAELPAGAWTVTIHGTDGLATLHESTVTLKAGQTHELTVDTK